MTFPSGQLLFHITAAPDRHRFSCIWDLVQERVVLTPDGHGMPAPYSITDNEDSFLDATDIVFIDAISTGYSRPAPGESPTQFHGLNEDASYFADFICQYITRGISGGIRRNI